MVNAKKVINKILGDRYSKSAWNYRKCPVCKKKKLVLQGTPGGLDQLYCENCGASFTADKLGRFDEPSLNK